MSPLASHRALAVAASLLLVAVGLTGCLNLPGGGSNSSDISSMKNIPEGIKRDLINQMNSASGTEKNKIIEKANALNTMVGAQLIGQSDGIFDEQFKLEENGTISVDKNSYAYRLMSATDYWRLGQNTYDLCVEQDCQYYSSWTVEVEGSDKDTTYVWTMKIDGPDQPAQPIVRRFKVK